MRSESQARYSRCGIPYSNIDAAGKRCTHSISTRKKCGGTILQAIKRVTRKQSSGVRQNTLGPSSMNRQRVPTTSMQSGCTVQTNHGTSRILGYSKLVVSDARQSFHCATPRSATTGVHRSLSRTCTLWAHLQVLHIRAVLFFHSVSRDLIGAGIQK